jgi:hypothetical protein
MATIRTHTTLRTLFVATAVFAVLAAMWTAAPRSFLTHMSATPSALSFLCALFGLSLTRAVVMAFLAGLMVDAYFIATIRYSGAPINLVIDEAFGHSIFIVCLGGSLCLTAWWWGSYLRYIWSNPERGSEPIPNDEISWDTYAGRFTFHERLLVRCDVLPVGFFCFTVMINGVIWFLVKGVLGL